MSGAEGHLGLNTLEESRGTLGDVGLGGLAPSTVSFSKSTLVNLARG